MANHHEPTYGEMRAVQRLTAAADAMSICIARNVADPAAHNRRRWYCSRRRLARRCRGWPLPDTSSLSTSSSEQDRCGGGIAVITAPVALRSAVTPFAARRGRRWLSARDELERIWSNRPAGAISNACGTAWQQWRSVGGWPGDPCEGRGNRAWPRPCRGAPGAYRGRQLHHSRCAGPQRPERLYVGALANLQGHRRHQAFIDPAPRGTTRAALRCGAGIPGGRGTRVPKV
jgi:hypothetical protein